MRPAAAPPAAPEFCDATLSPFLARRSLILAAGWIVLDILPIFTGLAILAGLGALGLLECGRGANWAGPLAAVLLLWVTVDRGAGPLRERP